MNTPSHAIINLALLLRQQAGATLPSGAEGAIVAGAIAPDVSMFVMYLWAKLIAHQPESQIWRDTYWQTLWQNLSSSSHSIPLIAIAIAICHFAPAHFGPWDSDQRRLGVLFFSSMLLHCLGDLPVHHDDAHRHFYPFSDYRFISPLSYWDPRHYGDIVGTVEKFLVLVSTVYLWPRVPSWSGRGLMLAVNAIYAAGLLHQLVRDRPLPTHIPHSPSTQTPVTHPPISASQPPQSSGQTTHPYPSQPPSQPS